MDINANNDISIMYTLIEDYQSIIKVDLKSGEALIVKSKNKIPNIETIVQWEEYIHEIAKEIHKNERDSLECLSINKLKEYYHHLEEFEPFEIRSINQQNTYDWIKVFVSIINNEKEQVLITTKETNESHMMGKIIDKYVYNNLDYFVLIDINKNTYRMFSGNANTPMPPEEGDNYEIEVTSYNDQFVVPEERKEITEKMMIKNIRDNLANNDIYEFSAGVFDAVGNYHRSRVQFSYYDRDEGLVIMTRADITKIYLEEGEKERKLAQALRDAKHDSLTNLYNSKATSELISNALQYQYRAQAVLFFIDLDNFKLVNDTLGHQVGDEVICFVAKKLLSIANKDGIAGRVGGDEFVLFLPVTSDMNQIEKYAREICDVLCENVKLKYQNLPVSSSVGISIYPNDGTTYRELLYKSDQALYDAKRTGKNQFSFFTQGMVEENGLVQYNFNN